MLDRRDWNSDYINRTAWILAHLPELKVTPEEALILLVISHLNDVKQTVTYEKLAESCHMDEEAIDDCFQTLSDKGYLLIDTKNNQLRFLLDGLIELPTAENLYPRQPVIREFEEEFGKTLSAAQMDKIAQLVSRFGERMVLRALDEASVYDRRSIDYVENVLISWKNRDLTLEDIEKGRR